MPASEIDDAPAAKEAAHTSRSFPGFEQLFAWQATGTTDDAAQPMKECVVWKASEIAIGQASS